MNRKSAFQFLLVFALLTAVACQSSRPHPDESYAVHSAYLESQILHNTHDYGDGKGVVLIRQSTATLDLQADAVPEIAEHLKGVDASTLSNFRQSIRESALLQHKFSLPTTYVIASEADIMAGKAKGDYGLAFCRESVLTGGEHKLSFIRTISADYVAGADTY